MPFKIDGFWLAIHKTSSFYSLSHPEAKRICSNNSGAEEAQADDMDRCGRRGGPVVRECVCVCAGVIVCFDLARSLEVSVVLIGLCPSVVAGCW